MKTELSHFCDLWRDRVPDHHRHVIVGQSVMLVIPGHTFWRPTLVGGGHTSVEDASERLPCRGHKTSAFATAGARVAFITSCVRGLAFSPLVPPPLCFLFLSGAFAERRYWKVIRRHWPKNRAADILRKLKRNRLAALQWGGTL